MGLFSEMGLMKHISSAMLLTMARKVQPISWISQGQILCALNCEVT